MSAFWFVVCVWTWMAGSLAIAVWLKLPVYLEDKEDPSIEPGLEGSRQPEG
jgi:hypothetical protein